MLFDDMEGLQEYATHPAHVRFAPLLERLVPHRSLLILKKGYKKTWI